MDQRMWVGANIRNPRHLCSRLRPRTFNGGGDAAHYPARAESCNRPAPTKPRSVPNAGGSVAISSNLARHVRCGAIERRNNAWSGEGFLVGLLLAPGSPAIGTHHSVI